MISLRAHFDGKSLVPDEPVDLPKDQPLVLHVDVPSSGHRDRDESTSADEWLADNAIDDPSLPVDGARQHDHYLYGSPKKP